LNIVKPYFISAEVQKIRADLNKQLQLKGGCASYRRVLRPEFRRSVKRTIKKRIVRKSAVQKINKEITNIQKQLKLAKGKKRTDLKNRIMRYRVIKGGRRYWTSYQRRCRGRISRYTALWKKTPAQKAVYLRKIKSIRNRIRRCRGFYKSPSVRKIRRTSVTRTIRKRVAKVRKNKSAIRSYNIKIRNLKNQARRVKGQKRATLKRNIMRLKVIRGGSRYVTSYVNRCRFLITRYRTQMIKYPAKKTIYLRRIAQKERGIKLCRGYWRRPAIRRIRKRFFYRKVPRRVIRRVRTNSCANLRTVILKLQGELAKATVAK
jgi:hypothetical protein